MMQRVTRLRDALVAVCRDCGREFNEFDNPYWGLATTIPMHMHKNDDGSWSKSGGVRRCILFG